MGKNDANFSLLRNGNWKRNEGQHGSTNSVQRRSSTTIKLNEQYLMCFVISRLPFESGCAKSFAAEQTNNNRVQQRQNFSAGRGQPALWSRGAF